MLPAPRFSPAMPSRWPRTPWRAATGVVTDNIRYRTTPVASEAWDSTANSRAAYLGLVANEVRIGSTAPQHLRIDAVMVCGSAGGSGKFWAPSYATTTPVGTVTVYGGAVANVAGYTATTRPTGWYDSYYYDPRMRVNPPPHFPTTGLYQRLSFKRTSAGPG